MNNKKLDELVFGSRKAPTKTYTPRRIERSGRFWNTADDATLSHWFKVRGFSVQECARRSGFSEDCIHAQLVRLNMNVKHREAWTTKDDRTLRALWSERSNGSWCARMMGKKIRTVNKRVRELGLQKSRNV